MRNIGCRYSIKIANAKAACVCTGKKLAETDGDIEKEPSQRGEPEHKDIKNRGIF